MDHGDIPEKRGDGWDDFKPVHSGRPQKKAGWGTFVMVVLLCGVVGGGIMFFVLMELLAGGVGRTHGIGVRHTENLTFEEVLGIGIVSFIVGVLGGAAFAWKMWFRVKDELKDD